MLLVQKLCKKLCDRVNLPHGIAGGGALSRSSRGVGGSGCDGGGSAIAARFERIFA